jgi:hypothetical protein
LPWFPSWFGVVHLVQVAFEHVEALAPQRAVGRQPVVDFAQWVEPQPVYATLGIHAGLDEAGLTQHAQVLRDGRLAHRQQLDELSHGSCAAAEEVEDAASVGLGEDLEGCRHTTEYA